MVVKICYQSDFLNLGIPKIKKHMDASNLITVGVNGLTEIKPPFPDIRLTSGLLIK